MTSSLNKLLHMYIQLCIIITTDVLLIHYRCKGKNDENNIYEFELKNKIFYFYDLLFKLITISI